MRTKRKLIIVIGFTLVILVAGFFCIENERESKWISSDGQIVSIGRKYSWIKGENYAEGKCKICRGDKAKEALLNYIEELVVGHHSLSSETLSEKEDELLDAVEKWREAIYGEGFVIEEDLRKTVINGVEIEPLNSVYIATFAEEDGERKLLLENPWNGWVVGLTEYNGEIPKQRNYKPIPIVATDIGFEYSLPQGYVIERSEDGFLLASSEADSIIVRVIKNGNIENLLKECPYIKELGQVYYCKRQIGASVEHAYTFKREDSLYSITSTDKASLDEFYASIRF